MKNKLKKYLNEASYNEKAIEEELNNFKWMILDSESMENLIVIISEAIADDNNFDKYEKKVSKDIDTIIAKGFKEIKTQISKYIKKNI